MKDEVRTLGLVSRPAVDSWGKGEAGLGYETQRLIRAGREIYGDVLLVNPFLVSVELPRAGGLPRIMHDGRPMPRVDSLFLRSTHRLGDALNATLRCLLLLGCDILDPISRQGYGRGSKLGTSFTRFTGGVGSSTFLAFSLPAAMTLARKLERGGRFPLIAKPVAGRGGIGVVRLDTPEALARHIKGLYGRAPHSTLLLQPFEDFVNEYRVMVFFGTALGVVRKIPAAGAVAANAAQGGTFVPADRPDIVKFVLDNVDQVGILGVDAGQTRAGEFTIIEANRAPKWQEFDRALGRDTARDLVLLARKRLDRQK